MCGIAGFLDSGRSRSRVELEAAAGRMRDSLRHRGPDDSGSWVDESQGIVLAHTRLAIVDLSPAGHQPMVSSDGRLVITYNGEIYNHHEIRAELVAKGHSFRGHSDTEVVLEACAAWGVTATLARLNGMFAFAIWDSARAALTLARDRIGIKPLYWSRQAAGYAFGSELKALRHAPGWSGQVDRNALTSYLRFGYVPSPQSILESVFKLPPGCSLEVRADREPALHRYWSAREVALAAAADPLRLDDEAAADALERLLKDAVGREMLADVPLGAFLSGGIDSSLVVALMQGQSARPVKTFSIGFEASELNEAEQAKAVARHLGTDHTELYAEPRHALDLVPRLAEWYDEPLADASQIPTYLVAALARRTVTVALSGDGGDELFHGYDRYAYVSTLWSRWERLPRPFRRGAARLAEALVGGSQSGWERPAELAMQALGITRPRDKLRRLPGFLGAADSDALNRVVVSRWQEPASLVIGGREPADAGVPVVSAAELPAIHDRLQLQDLTGYLPDDILTKVDRATMAVSLEARVPLLDHRVAEFAWRLPYRQRYREGRGKWLLRSVLYRHVPRSLVDRPKMGFNVPLGGWLRGPLKDWAGALLDPGRLHREGFLHPAPIEACWKDHLSGARDCANALWPVLCFQGWRERWGGCGSAPTDGR
jgi:asparagine synthase (glutamine-hydrolysing)